MSSAIQQNWFAVSRNNFLAASQYVNCDVYDWNIFAKSTFCSKALKKKSWTSSFEGNGVGGKAGACEDVGSGNAISALKDPVNRRPNEL